MYLDFDEGRVVYLSCISRLFQPAVRAISLYKQRKSFRPQDTDYMDVRTVVYIAKLNRVFIVYDSRTTWNSLHLHDQSSAARQKTSITEVSTSFQSLRFSCVCHICSSAHSLSCPAQLSHSFTPSTIYFHLFGWSII